MNTEEKNIETCLAENILAEVASVPQDPQFRSLVNESIDPLQQQALQQAGCDAYKEVVVYHKPYTFTSSVKQMKSNLILLLRRLWRFPFGRGAIRSFADMWAHYITRLQGNAEYCIPSRLSSLTDLPSAPALLADRKISGVPEAVDGMSLVQLACSTVVNEVTELTDSNTGWNMNELYACDRLATLFPNLSIVAVNCKKITRLPYEKNYWGDQLKPNYDIEYGEGVEGIYVAYSINKKPSIKDEFLLPGVKHIRPAEDMSTLSGNIGTPSITGKGVVRADELEDWCLGTYNSCAINGDELKAFIAPKLKIISRLYGNDANGFVNTCPQLIHLEFGEGFAGYYGWEGTSTPLQTSSVNLKKWEATNALDANRTDLIEEGSTATSNLQQFLMNFRDYIADRLADRSTEQSQLTLTLSAAVFSAVIEGAEPICDEIKGIIEDKHWKVQDTTNNIFPA